MGPNDVGTPLHRDMGVHVTRGVEPWLVFAQYMGREGGPTRGRDGTVELPDDLRERRTRQNIHTLTQQ